MIDPVFHALIAWSLGILFLATSIHKLSDYAKFRASLQAYQVVPAKAISVIAPSVVGLELSAALMLFFGPIYLGAGAAILLLLSYASAIALNLARGRTSIDCGCHFGRSTGRISNSLVVRNTVLSLLALTCFLPVEVRAEHWGDGVALTFGLVSLCLIYLCFEALIHNAQVWDWEGAQ